MVPGSWSQGSGRPSFVSGTEKGTWKHRRGEKSRGASWEGRGSRMRSWCFRCWDVPEGCSQAVVGSSVVLRSSPCLHGMKLTQSLAVGMAGRPPPAAGALGDGPTEGEAMLRCGPWFLGIPCALLSLLPAALHPARPARDPRLAGGEDFGEAGWDLQPRGFLSYLELPAAPFGSAPAPSHLHLPVVGASSASSISLVCFIPKAVGSFSLCWSKRLLSEALTCRCPK